MTGWTLYLGKECSDVIQRQIKFFSMRGPLLVKTNFLSTLHVVHYSCLVRINSLNSTYVRMCMSRRKCAWFLPCSAMFSLSEKCRAGQLKQKYSSCILQKRLNIESFNNKPLLIFNIINKSVGRRFYNVAVDQQLMKDKIKLNPFFVSGIIDAEGCFFLNTYLDKKTKSGWAIKPSFKLALHSKDKALLEDLQIFFKVGKIYKQRENSVEYRVQNLKDLQILLAHLDKYQLLTQKRKDYELLKKAIHLMLNKTHLTLEGLRQIISIKAAMNWGVSDRLKLAIEQQGLIIYKGSDIIPVFDKPLFIVKKTESYSSSVGWWLAGFSSGEGCFLCTISKSNKAKLGATVLLRFIVTQHCKEEELMLNLIQYFGCGSINKESNREIINFVVGKLSDITEKIIPFFSRYPIKGTKYQDFLAFCQIAELMKKKIHLTKEGLDQIRLIKASMNRSNSGDLSTLPSLDNTSLDLSLNLTNLPKDIVTESDLDTSSCKR